MREFTYSSKDFFDIINCVDFTSPIAEHDAELLNFTTSNEVGRVNLVFKRSDKGIELHQSLNVNGEPNETDLVISDEEFPEFFDKISKSFPGIKNEFMKKGADFISQFSVAQKMNQLNSFLVDAITSENLLSDIKKNDLSHEFFNYIQRTQGDLESYSHNVGDARLFSNYSIVPEKFKNSKENVVCKSSDGSFELREFLTGNNQRKEFILCEKINYLGQDFTFYTVCKSLNVFNELLLPAIKIKSPEIADQLKKQCDDYSLKKQKASGLDFLSLYLPKNKQDAPVTPLPESESPVFEVAPPKHDLTEVQEEAIDHKSDLTVGKTKVFELKNPAVVETFSVNEGAMLSEKAQRSAGDFSIPPKLIVETSGKSPEFDSLFERNCLTNKHLSAPGSKFFNVAGTLLAAFPKALASAGLVFYKDLTSALRGDRMNSDDKLNFASSLGFKYEYLEAQKQEDQRLLGNVRGGEGLDLSGVNDPKIPSGDRSIAM